MAGLGPAGLGFLPLLLAIRRRGLGGGARGLLRPLQAQHQLDQLFLLDAWAPARAQSHHRHGRGRGCAGKAHIQLDQPHSKRGGLCTCAPAFSGAAQPPPARPRSRRDSAPPPLDRPPRRPRRAWFWTYRSRRKLLYGGPWSVLLGMRLGSARPSNPRQLMRAKVRADQPLRTTDIPSWRIVRASVASLMWTLVFGRWTDQAVPAAKRHTIPTITAPVSLSWWGALKSSTSLS